jgi:dTDP-4-amino-4,6-dideoxygalactose transaminase
MQATQAATVRFHAPALPDVEGFLEDVREILTSGWLSQGQFVGRLEDRFLDMTGAKAAIAVSNASGGLIAALSVLGRPGGEVIVPGYTYLATWQSVVWAGMVPVVVDVDEQALLDPDAVADAVTPKTAAILPVHIAGSPADMESLRQIADRAGVPIIADAAHAVGSRTARGPVGRDGDAEVFSIGATKQLVAGEGGVVVLRDAARAGLVRRFALQGHVPGSMDPLGPGLNLRLPELSAALALRGLPGLEGQLQRREIVHDRYALAFADLPLRLSGPRSGERSGHKDQLVWLDDETHRAPLRRHLAARGVETRGYYEVAVADSTSFEGRVASTDRSRDLARRSFAIPIHARLTDDDVERVVDGVRSWFESGA